MADSHVTIYGRASADPKTWDDSEKVTFSVASNHSYKRKDSAEWESGPALWFNVEAWGWTGKRAMSLVSKGKKIMVCGELYGKESKDGTVRMHVKAWKIASLGVNEPAAPTYSEGIDAPF